MGNSTYQWPYLLATTRKHQHTPSVSRVQQKAKQSGRAQHLWCVINISVLMAIQVKPCCSKHRIVARSLDRKASRADLCGNRRHQNPMPTMFPVTNANVKNRSRCFTSACGIQQNVSTQQHVSTGVWAGQDSPARGARCTIPGWPASTQRPSPPSTFAPLWLPRGCCQAGYLQCRSTWLEAQVKQQYFAARPHLSEMAFLLASPSLHSCRFACASPRRRQTKSTGLG